LISLVVFIGASLAAAEETTLTFRADDVMPYSVLEEVNVVQSNEPNSIMRFWIKWQAQ
jgi:hypothetical protein